MTTYYQIPIVNKRFDLAAVRWLIFCSTLLVVTALWVSIETVMEDVRMTRTPTKYLNSSEMRAEKVQKKENVDIFLERRLHIQEVCRTYREAATRTTGDLVRETHRGAFNLSTFQMKHMIVDHKHQVLYCFVPKVGTTNWKRIMIVLRGLRNITDPLQIDRSAAHKYYYHRFFSGESPIVQKKILETYTKIIAVRHPIERILSAYRNKFESKTAPSQWFHENIGRNIIKKFRSCATNESLSKGDDVTFLEFVRYLLEDDAALDYNFGQSYNEHWEPINSLCNPCIMNYDYVIKLENLVAESNEVLRRLKVTNVEYPAQNEIAPEATKKKMGQYFDEIPLKYIRKLEDVYRFDGMLFNYSEVEDGFLF